MTAAAVVPVIRTEHRAGRGTPDDPARMVTSYWSLEGALLWADDPEGALLWADDPCTPAPATRRPTRYEVAAALASGDSTRPFHLVAADAVLALWDAPGCRVCGAGVPVGATECGSDHQ